MKHWQFSKDGGFREYEFSSGSLYVLQRMRTRDNKVVNAGDYLEILNNTFQSLTGKYTTLSIKTIEDTCSQLLTIGNYSPTACHIIEIAYDMDHNFAVRVVETSIYKTLSIRAVRPVAQMFYFAHKELNLPTSAAVTTNELFRHMARLQDADIPVYIDIDGFVESVDGASPIIVQGRDITISANIESVEALTLLEALQNIPNYHLHFGSISFADVMAADEFFYVDYRGITVVQSMSGHMYSDNIPTMALRALNFNLQ